MSNVVTRQLPSYRRLMRYGAIADSIVVETTLRFPSARPSASTDYRLQVHFDDGSKTTVIRRENATSLGWPRAGDILPVRYDPEDRSKIEIDRRRNNRERACRDAKLRLSVLRDAQQALARRRQQLSTKTATGHLAPARAQKTGDVQP